MKRGTRCGRTISVTRFAPRGLQTSMGASSRTLPAPPHDEGEPWVSPTAEEALRLAGLLLFQAAAVEPEPVGRPGVAEVVPIVGDAFEMRIRGHVPTVGQPLSDGG
ncbi:hypothetical protein [Streptomyces sp. NPDC058625]|uniref:hypothetical protein n=1 Tax=Streptomyces sp. NPDC058625 TaxID=3346564 RepID=UPI00365EACD7